MAAVEERDLSPIDRLRELQTDFEKRISEAAGSEAPTLIVEFIHRVVVSNVRVNIGDFGADMEWVNTSRPLSASSDLKGRVVILDFFTFCCINCLHILPHLKSLEQEHEGRGGLLVIGVHSAKFEHEKDLCSLASAVQKLGITHPVVNDVSCMLWHRLQVHCWPTLVVLGPTGQLLLFLEGETGLTLLAPFCREALDYFRGSLRPVPLPMAAYKMSTGQPSSLLWFPAKVCANGSKLAIADTGHHRVLLVSVTGKPSSRLTGKVAAVAGGDSPGFLDGSLEAARFCDPHGLAWQGSNCLYVADTSNHAVREINWSSRLVQTVAGTGEMGDDRTGGHPGHQQALNSPWDLVLDGNVLYVAMAGFHQVWGLLLEDDTLFGKRQYSKGTCVCIAGTGEEGNRNNSYPHRATFAQPSGITVQSGEALYIADSESSSIRSVSLKDGAVRNIVGGSMDPKNLFCFGDRDGVGQHARLQHPLGVAFTDAKKQLYVADSYNNKVRVVDVRTRKCETLVGLDDSGDTADTCDVDQESVPKGKPFSEPGGLCVGNDCLYVADTNNHAIKVVCLDTLQVQELQLEPPLHRSVPVLGKKATRTLPSVRLAPGASLEVAIDVPDGLAAEAPHRWNLQCDDSLFEPPSHTNGSIDGGTLRVQLQLRDTATCASCCHVQLSLQAYLCAHGLCMPVASCIDVPVIVDSLGGEQERLQVPWALDA